MDDPSVAVGGCNRRSKRNRSSYRATEAEHSKANAVSGENQERNNSTSDEKESPPEDFEEMLPKTKRGRRAEEADYPPDQSLIEVIRRGGNIIFQAVRHWVERYEKKPQPAMIELLSMLFEACGTKYHFKEESLDEIDVDDVVVTLVNLARRGEAEDYQSSKKKDFKNFKENLVSFWDNLVTECQSKPLFDKCMDYIIALSCTPPRVYRHVASLIGLQLVTSLISVAKMLAAQRDTTQRQLDTEKKKKRAEGSLMSLNNKLPVTQEKINMIAEMMRKIFTGLFVHRYRDVDPDIRMTCIQSLGAWISSYPSFFLKDLYLKYLGWTLNDKNAGVRKASVLALQNLYEDDDNVPTLSLFTERFSNRMIELADDIDVSVAVCAIGLVKQLIRHQLLPDDDLGSLYDLLIDEIPEIRRAIGEFVYDHLIAQKFNSPQPVSKGNDSVVHLGRMLQILREFSTDPILSIYVIDDVWEYMEAMKDWKCIISMLLDENPSIELTDEDATNLIRLLFASIKKAIGERIVPVSDNRKQNYNKGQKEIFEKNRHGITVAMMKNYPLLLSKYMADKEKVASLVEIIVYMDLELYSLKRQEQSFTTDLQLIKDAFFKHGEKDALRSCVKAINVCTTSSQGELQDFARIKFKNLEDDLIAKLKSAIKEIMDGEDDYSLLVNLKRLYELQLSRPVSIESLYGDIATFFHNFRNLDDEVVSFLLLNMYLHVAWSLHSIINSENVSEASLSSLLSKRDTFFVELERLLDPTSEVDKDTGPGNQLACRVCIILADMWCLFRKENFPSAKLHRLAYCPDSSFLQKFWRLCEQQLNISDDTEDEDMNKEYIEETNRDAVMIAAGRLIVSDAVPKEYLAPEIISHFVMHGPKVAEIVKHLITVWKKKDEVFPIFLEALKKAYRRCIVEPSKGQDDSSEANNFQECRDLAARLSGIFIGTARNKHRQDILRIIKEGIEYAFLDPPENLPFLEIAVLQFVSKLPLPDIRHILGVVHKHTENVNTDEDPSGWRPYFIFCGNLQEKCAKNEGVREEKEGSTVRRKGRPRKQRNIEGKRLFDEQSSSEEDEDPISTSDQDDAQGDRQDEEEDEEAPVIQSSKCSSRLRSLRVSRDQNRDQTAAGATDNLTASRTQV